MQFRTLLTIIALAGVLTTGTSYALTVFDDDLAITPQKKLFFDNGSDTYITESSNDIMSFFAGGSNILEINGNANSMDIHKKTIIDTQAAGVALELYRQDNNVGNAYPMGSYIYKDNSDGTKTKVAGLFGYWKDNASGSEDGELEIVLNKEGTGTIQYVFTNKELVLKNGIDLKVQPTQKLYLDGGSNTYITESLNDELDFYANGIKKISLGSDICIGNCPNP